MSESEADRIVSERIGATLMFIKKDTTVLFDDDDNTMVRSDAELKSWAIEYPVKFRLSDGGVYHTNSPDELKAYLRNQGYKEFSI